MALTSRFVGAEEIRGSFVQGRQSTGALFELGRRLRDLDQNFQFNQAANPLRLSQLEQTLRSSRLSNDFNETTFDNRVDAVGFDTEIRRDNATISRATVPTRIDNAALENQQNRLTVQSDALNLQAQAATQNSNITAQIANNQAVLQNLEIARNEAARLGIDLDRFVPPNVAETIKQATQTLAQVEGIEQASAGKTQESQQLLSEKDQEIIALRAQLEQLGVDADTVVPPSVSANGAPAAALPTQEITPAPPTRRIDATQLFQPTTALDAALADAGLTSATPFQTTPNPLRRSISAPRRLTNSFGEPFGAVSAGGASNSNRQPVGAPVSSASQTRVRNVRGGVPVSNGGSIVKQLFPQARITQTRRSAKSKLGKANRGSFHVRTNAAVDVAPIPGVTFGQFVNSFAAKGYVVLEAIDEVRNPSSHATGPHWHIVLGEQRKAA